MKHEVEIDLQELFLHWVKQLKFILPLTLLASLGAFLVCMLLPAQYTASTRIYVPNRTSSYAMAYSDYQAANHIIADYQVLITGENVTKALIRELELPLTVRELEKKIRLEAPEDTRFLEISVTDHDPELAARMANTLRRITCSEILRVMDVDAVNLVYEAEVPQKPSGPKTLKITLLTALVAFCLLTMGFSLAHMMDDTIRTEEDVQARLGLHVLAVFPDSRALNSPKKNSKKNQRC